MQNFVTEITNRLSMSKSHHRLMSGFVLIAVLFVAMGQSFADNRTQAKRIHDRLAGVAPSSAVLSSMEALIATEMLRMQLMRLIWQWTISIFITRLWLT